MSLFPAQFDSKGVQITAGALVRDRYGAVHRVEVVLPLQVFIGPNDWLHPANCVVVS